MPPVVAALAVVAGTLMLAPAIAHADIFYCVDARGKTLFTDAPCPKGTRTSDVTVSAPIDHSREQQAELARQAAAAQLAQRRRADDLERENAELRGALESAQAEVQAAAAPQALPEPVYPPPSTIIVVGGCKGRDCANHHPGHGDGNHPGHGDGNHSGHGEGNHPGHGDANHPKPSPNPPSPPSASLRPPT